MHRTFLVTLAFIATLTALYAERRSIAVLPFIARGAEDVAASVMEDEFRVRLVERNVYIVLDRAHMERGYCWYRDNSGLSAHPVGQKLPNAWGLYNMIGNVWEWCHDWYGGYPSGSVTDPQGATSGTDCVLRGGGWGSYAGHCCSADRGNDSLYNYNYVIGFRVVCNCTD